MFKLKRISSGRYAIIGTTIVLEKYDGFWYAFDTFTMESVVDCERTKRELLSSVSSVYHNYISK